MDNKKTKSYSLNLKNIEYIEKIAYEQNKKKSDVLNKIIEEYINVNK